MSRVFPGPSARALFALAETVVLAMLAPCAVADAIVDGDLPRRADLGFASSTDSGRLAVARVDGGSPAAQAGLAKDDVIVSINGQRLEKPYHGNAMLVRVAGGQPVTLEVRRGEAAPHTLRFTPPPGAYEDVPGVDSHYGVVTLPDGTRLRTIVTRPQGTTGRLPVIFFTQWVSCGTIEFTRGGLSREILKTLARESGAALVRVERAGAGDSEGAACHELDYDTEVAHYRAALDAVLQRYDWLDPARLVIYGSSLGSTVAPLVAQGRPVAGLIVQGGGAVTYLERMINFDRQQLERTDVPVDEIHARMQRQIAFHVEYLVRGRDPDAITRDGTEMAAARSAIRGLGDGEHYGRPYAWHQQAARRNFAAAWAAIDAPVLVIYGEFDQFEARRGHEWIADIVNRRHPGRATFLAVPRMDHEGDVYDSIEDAYAWERQVSGEPAQAHRLQTGPMLRWLGALPGFAAAR